MPRYFIEISYKGTHYAGFQVQHNANSVQAEIEKALQILFKDQFNLTGSSRTDAGVHAYQNFFHFDSVDPLITNVEKENEFVYSLNAILPRDIVVKKIRKVQSDVHCRFNALSREYHYYIYQQKNPFLQDRAYYFPYTINFELLQQAAKMLMGQQDFSSFSKRRTQVKTFVCNITESGWIQNEYGLMYRVKANRFLRGMVKGLVGTMLQVGREKISVGQFSTIIQARDASLADFSVPSHALFLVKVNYPDFV